MTDKKPGPEPDGTLKGQAEEGKVEFAPPELCRSASSVITSRLRQAYDETLHAPLPPRVTDLLRKLAEGGGGRT